MSGNQNHHICIHGHFYQPPRENPWLGIIEEQESAFPFMNWNERISAESYEALSCSPVTSGDEQVDDMFNCYAHMSYNFGPTIFEWMQKNCPSTLGRITLGDELSRQSYSDNGGAIAQVYNHMIMPLADARDKHTQIVWGLKEFESRYGHSAESIWLAETAINMDTVRTLIDHNVKFVILSPLQASYVRRFGQQQWTGVPDGTIETRHPYRLFEVDGAGKTHFNRYIDVFFYDKDLSTQVSFNHLLSDAQKLEWHIRERMDDDANLPQIVIIATDGEIYGHHEKHGNRALAYFFNQMFKNRNMLLTNPSLYLEENPPCWEVRLWEGIDGKGSSWSCSHGVSRWEKDCGCTDGPFEWNQQWRTPLRQAFDELRFHLRKIYRREMGGLVYDALDARNDYIQILLNPDQNTREAFLKRHAQKSLSRDEQTRLWQLLEMDRHAMLMYTSCGWFFGEVSGLEPVQNMRYALRAAQLAMNFTKDNLIALLQKRLEKVKSNIPEQGDGAQIFRNHVLSTCYGFKEVCAVNALCSMLELDCPEYNIICQLSNIDKTSHAGLELMTGEAICRDKWTSEEESLHFLAVISRNKTCGVLFFPEAKKAKALLKSPAKEIEELVEKEGVHLCNLPFTERKKVFSKVFGTDVMQINTELATLYDDSMPLLEKLTGNRLPLPPSLRSIGKRVLTNKLEAVVNKISSESKLQSESTKETLDIFEQARCAGLELELFSSSRILAGTLASMLENLMLELTLERIEEVLELMLYIRKFGFTLDNWDMLLDRYWRTLHLSPRPMPSSRAIVDAMRELGGIFNFNPQVVIQLTRTLFSTPV